MYACVIKRERSKLVLFFRLGAVGLACIEGSLLSGASQIIAIDINRDRGEEALRFGATDYLSPHDCEGLPIAEYILQHFNGEANNKKRQRDRDRDRDRERQKK